MRRHIQADGCKIERRWRDNMTALARQELADEYWDARRSGAVTVGFDMWLKMRGREAYRLVRLGGTV